MYTSYVTDYQKKRGFFERVYEFVRTIPEGKVVTYGQIAKMLGTSDARKVGWALAVNSDENTPCHRVVSKDGRLAKNFGKSLDREAGWRTQKQLLEDEGITFSNEQFVDLDKYQWVNET